MHKDSRSRPGMPKLAAGRSLVCLSQVSLDSIEAEVPKFWIGDLAV